MNQARNRRLAFLGGKPLSAKCLSHLYEYHRRGEVEIAAVLPRPKGFRGWWSGPGVVEVRDLAESLNLTTVDSETELLDHSIDLGLSVLHNRILPERVIRHARRGFLNLHCAPLPHYRGCNAYTHAILNGEKRFGPTLHVMDGRVDHGDIIEVCWLDVPEDATARQLMTQTEEAAFALFCKWLPWILCNDFPAESQERIIQKAGVVSRYYRRDSLADPSLKRVFLDWPREVILRHVRAFDFPPFEPAYLDIGGRKIHLTFGAMGLRQPSRDRQGEAEPHDPDVVFGSSGTSAPNHDHLPPALDAQPQRGTSHQVGKGRAAAAFRCDHRTDVRHANSDRAAAHTRPCREGNQQAERSSRDAIPLCDLRAMHEPIRAELEDALRSVVDSSRFIGGPQIEAFAREFASYCGVAHVVPCSNGTEALRWALVGVLGQGDGSGRIITVSHTFAATAEAILAAGYTPDFVDIDPETYLMDLDAAAAAMTPQTVAVVPVHLYGQMVDMVRLNAWARAKGLAVVEDASQAVGASYRAVRPGQLSDAAAFSFFPGKNLGAWGDAGAIVCRDPGLASRIRSLVDHGRSRKHEHERVGWNARMDAVQAAILRVKLRHIDPWNRLRRAAAQSYDARLREQTRYQPPRTPPQALHVYHQYVVRVPDRANVQRALTREGIDTGVHYPIPLHEQPAYRFLGLPAEALPVTHQICKEVLSLPMFPGLSEEQISRVVSALAAWEPAPAKSS